MSVSTLASLIGQTATIPLPGGSSKDGNPARVLVRIVEARVSFGRQDIRIEPLQGTGSVWVSLDSVRLTEPK